MSPKGALLILLSFTNIKLDVSQEAKTVLKAGVILDNDVDQESLREAVDKLIEYYRPWLPESRIVTVWSSLNSSASLHVTKRVHQLLKLGVQALVTALRCPQLRSVAALAEQFNLPHISISLESCRTQKPGQFTIHLTTQNEIRHKVLSEIVRFVGWKRIAFTVDKSVDNRQRHDLVLELSQNGIESVLITLPLMSTWSTHHNTLAFVTTSANIPELMSWASDTQMMGPDYWLIVFTSDLTTSNLNDVFKPYNSSNILIAKVKLRRIADIILLSAKPRIQPDELISVPEFGVFEALVLYRLAVENNVVINGTAFTSVRQNQSVNDSSELVERLRQVCGSAEGNPGHPCGSTEYDLYSTQANSETLVHVGEWTVSNKLTTWDNKLFLNSFTGLSSFTIRIGLLNRDSKPFVSWNEERNAYEGLLIDIVEDIAKTLQFNYTFIESPDGLFGHRLSSGSWTGVIGMVARKEVELAAAHLTVTPERSQVVDFTTAFMQDSLGILTPKPRDVSGLFQIFKPFSVNVWFTSVAFVLTAFIMFITISIKTYPATGREKTMQHYVTENVFLLISSCFEQGQTFHPTSISARCFLTFWFVFALMLINMYTAHLVAVLTVSTPLKPINNLQDLLNQPDMKILANYGSNTWSLLSGSDNLVYRQAGERLEKYEQTVDPIKAGGYSFVTDRSYLSYLAITNCGEVRLADEPFQGYSLAFAIPKNVTYKKAIDRSIQKMVESGVILQLTRKWWTPSANCSGQPRKTKAVVVCMDRISGIFIVYIGMCIAAGFGLLTERLLSKWFPRNACQTLEEPS